MGLKAYEETDIQAIANAIRTMNGTQTLYKVEDMADAVLDIPIRTDARVEQLLTRTGSLDLSDIEVTAILARTFTDGGYSEVILPETVEIINSYAFDNCANLTSVTLPTALEYIDNYAFRSCSNLVINELPESVEFIGYLSFGSCPKLAIKAIPTSTTEIGRQAFSNDTGLETLWIGRNCQTIYGNTATTGAFAGCTGLTDIYCEATSKPAGWGTYWNYRASSSSITVHWGVSRAEYEAIINS